MFYWAPREGAIFVQRTKPRATAGRFAPASVKAAMEEWPVKPSARETLFGMFASENRIF